MNWFTFVAQIVNFLILVVLLRKFLYRPVLQAMDERQQRIEDRLAEARQREEEADAKRQEYEQELEDIENTRDEKMQQARDAAEEEKQQRLEAVRDEVREQKERWQQALAEEQADLAEDLRRQVAAGVFTVSRRLLRELADAELESRMANRLGERLDDLDDQQRQKVREALADETVAIHSAFELDDETRERLQKALSQRLDAQISVDFQEDTDVLCGLKIHAGDHEIAWTLAAELDNLEDTVHERLAQARDTESDAGEEA